MTVYAVDLYRQLYRIEWQDIKEGIYQKKLIKSDVKNFYVDKILGTAIVNEVGTLYLDNEVEVDLTKVNTEAEWTIVTCVAKCWIVSEDLDLDHDGHAIMASINEKGDVKSTLKLKLTNNGYIEEIVKDEEESIEGGKARFAGIYALRKVYVTGRRGIMMAIERDGCCHLMSVYYGRLSVLQSIASIVPLDVVKDERYRVVMSVTATGAKGEFIVGGSNWTKLITVKYR
jgi:hypothetical protein